jgi:hypothetical protein
VVSFSVDSAAIEQTLNKMTQQLAGFPTQMGDELTNWQREDMHRHFPNTQTPDPHTAFTLIWPRSRLTDQKKHEHKALVVRRALPPTFIGQHRSARPILRPELFDRLVTRMRMLLDTTMTWPKGKAG